MLRVAVVSAGWLGETPVRERLEVGASDDAWLEALRRVIEQAHP
jgi:hypothetical protein